MSSESKTPKVDENGVADMSLDFGASKAEVKAETKGASAAMSLDDSSMEGDLKITSKDQKDFNVAKKFACISNLIKTSLEQDAAATDVPLPGVTSVVFKEILRYMEHHKGTEPPIVEKPLRSKVMKEVCKDPWDAEFIDAIGENRQLLYDTILGANYLDITGLLHLGCAKVASLIKGQPLEKIKEILSKGITPAAEAKAETKRA